MEYKEPEIINEISKLLRTQIPRDDEELESHIIELNALQLDIAEAIANTQRLLYEKRKQMLWPKDKDTTELDRKTRLDADTAIIQRTYELLIRIEQIVYQRLQVCLELL